MSKKIAAVAGALSGLLAVAPSVLRAESFADLLQPIPNASETLRALDASDTAAPELVPVSTRRHSAMARPPVRHYHPIHHHHPVHRRHHHRGPVALHRQDHPS